jgi:hypothetical protein
MKKMISFIEVVVFVFMLASAPILGACSIQEEQAISQKKPIVQTPEPSVQPAPHSSSPTPTPVSEKKLEEFDDKACNEILKEYRDLCQKAKVEAGSDKNKLRSAVIMCSNGFIPLLKSHGFEKKHWDHYSKSHSEAIVKLSEAWK